LQRSKVLAVFQPPSEEKANDSLELVDEKRAAAILGLSPSTLQKDRGRKHPRFPYVKLGSRVLYRPIDLRRVIERALVPAEAL
jgi:hypothetical protein